MGHVFVCQHLLLSGDADRARRECCLMGTSTSEANLVSSLLCYIRDDWYITLAGLQGSTLRAMIKSKKHGGARPSRCRGLLLSLGKQRWLQRSLQIPWVTCLLRQEDEEEDVRKMGKGGRTILLGSIYRFFRESTWKWNKIEKDQPHCNIVGTKRCLITGRYA